MKGLIIKDLLNLKKVGMSYMLFIILYGGISIAMKNSGLLSGMMAVIIMMMPITACSYDERCGWDKYALTMPISRKALVGGKYMLILVLSFLAFVLSFIVNLTVFAGQADFVATALSVTGATTLLGVFYSALLLPIIFKYGTEKSRVMMMLVLLLPVAAIMGISSLMPDLSMKVLATITAPQNITLVGTCVVSVVLALFGLSYLLSVKIFGKKDL